MRRRFRISTLSKGQLRAWLALTFVALAVPTGVLVQQAYTQLKWEAFHHYRQLAEDLTRRIDADLGDLVVEAEAYSFADYSFLVVEGDTGSNFLQRSPLSAFPVTSDLPGVLGYFQVDGEGRFSSPLLPADDTPPETVGLSPDEFAARQARARRILEVLGANRLVHGAPGEPYSLRADDAAVSAAPARADEQYEFGAQAGFDALSRARETKSAPLADTSARPAAADADGDAAGTGEAAASQSANSLGKVADLNFEAPYRQELEESEPAAAAVEERAARAVRKERVALPESVPVTAGEPEVLFLTGRDIHIDTFESEIDPLELSLLESGHFVLFRKVWRDRERFIQGMLIERDAFMREALARYFDGSATAGMSDLLVAWGEDLIWSGSGNDPSRYASGGLASPAPLLYRSRLSSPLDGLELIYRIRHLPPGPGASVLAWVTGVIALVFCGGFAALYRLGAGQIDLARQQQDFVSAVSHELKTPLTSIRMYGEMLKEGWAEPGKRQQYYEYIHEESERLTRLIANVLQLASITRHQPKLELAAVEVGRLMQDVESRIADQVRHAGFELRVDRDPRAETARVEVDADCFMQIVINLVDNAIKFSARADNRAIELASRPGSDGGIRFSVRDFGPGIPPNQMKKIFRLFYRAGNELTRETVGTGIGLAIVHELAQAMGGKVDVINRDPGAEFTLTLPLPPVGARLAGD